LSLQNVLLSSFITNTAVQVPNSDDDADDGDDADDADDDGDDDGDDVLWL